MLKRLGYLVFCLLITYVVVYQSGRALAWRDIYDLGKFEANLGQDSHYGILDFTWFLLGGFAALLASLPHFVEVLFPQPLNWYLRLVVVLSSAAIAVIYGQRLIVPVLIPSLSATAIAPPAIFIAVLLVGVELVIWLAIVLAANAGLLVLGRVLSIIVRSVRDAG